MCYHIRKSEDILSNRNIKATWALQYGVFNCYLLLGDQARPWWQVPLGFCTSVYRQNDKRLRPHPTIQRTTLLRLNQKGVSIPDSSSQPHLSCSQFWAESNILDVSFSVLNKRFARMCSEVALKQGELWHCQQEPCLAHLLYCFFWGLYRYMQIHTYKKHRHSHTYICIQTYIKAMLKNCLFKAQTWED